MFNSPYGNCRDQNLNGRITYTFEGGNDGDGAFVVDVYSGIVRKPRKDMIIKVPKSKLIRSLHSVVIGGGL